MLRSVTGQIASRNVAGQSRESEWIEKRGKKERFFLREEKDLIINKRGGRHVTCLWG